MNITIEKAIEVLAACGYECPELAACEEDRQTQLETKTQFMRELNVVEQQLATLKQSALGHMRLYRLFTCEGGDCYDPECAEKNLDKVMEILSK
jgi:hypothetical protein